MKFSIRDLLWLTVVVALVLGWVVDHWQRPTTSRIKAMLRRSGYAYGKDHRNNIEQYMSSDGGKVITAWECKDFQNPAFSDSDDDAESPNSSEPNPNPPKP
jgi:hypothetical protein